MRSWLNDPLLALLRLMVRLVVWAVRRSAGAPGRVDTELV
jgi:hypothetical protein